MRTKYLDVPVTFDGKEATLREWIRESGIQTTTIIGRLLRGLSPLESLTKPDQRGNCLKVMNTYPGLFSPSGPLITIGSSHKTIMQWCEQAGISLASVMRAVNGGISPLYALTVWCDDCDRLWTCYWDEQFCSAKAADEYSLSEADISLMGQLYHSVDRRDRVCPIDFCRRYSLFHVNADAFIAASYYENSASDGSFTYPSSHQADPRVTALFNHIKPVAHAAEQSLCEMLQVALKDLDERLRSDCERLFTKRQLQYTCDLLCSICIKTESLCLAQ